MRRATGSWSRKCGGSRPRKLGGTKLRRSGGALSTPSSWPTRTSTRSRGCTPTPAFMQKIEGMFEGDYKVVFHLAPPHVEQARSRDRRSEEIHLRPVDDARIPVAGEAQRPARHGARHFRPHRGTPQRARADCRIRRHRGRTAAQSSRPRTTRLRSRLPASPRLIRGYGHVKVRHLKQAQKQRAGLLAKFNAPVERTAKAA